MNKTTLKNARVALVLVIVFSFAVAALPPQKVMAAPTISSISPASGVVGDTVMLNGAIDTSNGFFVVRWNQTLNITSGYAAGLNVSASFLIPQTVGAPSGRNVIVELIDNATGAIATTNFTLFTKLHMNVETPTVPNQLQEGSAIPISVNVTGGEVNTVYTANITVKNPANQTNSIFPSLSNTTSIGYGESLKTYPTDFVGTSTNYTGKYTVAFNGTVLREFQIGLTDKSVYRRNETVLIKATGYDTSEIVTVNINTAVSSVTGFPKNVTASSGGIVNLSWKIPLNATPGNYTLNFLNATAGGTQKTPSDTQNFEVLGFTVRVQTNNQADEPVGNAVVEVYNATTPSMLLIKGNTNSTGWIRFNLDGGRYDFKAFVKKGVFEVEVGSLTNRSVIADTEFDLPLRLINLLATVETEKGSGVPFIDVALNYSYRTRDNKTKSETLSMQTNLTGKAELHNLFTNTTYRVEAKRFGMLFSNTTLPIELSPASGWINLDLTLPTYRLNVHAVDSQKEAANGIQIRIYEWASGVTTALLISETDSSGNASFSLPFGQYRLRAYKGDAFLNDTVINLFENPVAFTLYLTTANVGVSVSAFDYFGQPMANAEVKIERKVDQGYVLVDSEFTGTDGFASFTLSVGGDFRVSVYVAGRLAAVKNQFLGAGSNQVEFRIGEYVAILGYPVGTSLFALFSFILILVVALLVLTRGRWMKALGKRVKR